MSDAPEAEANVEIDRGEDEDDEEDVEKGISFIVTASAVI